MSDYRPVDCARHSEYELAITQRRRLQLTWYDGDGASRTETVTPVDLYARRGEEFLRVARSGGQEDEIRLDRIIACGDA